MKKKFFIIITVFIVILILIFSMVFDSLYSSNIRIEKQKTFIDIPKKIDTDSLSIILSPYLISKNKFKLALMLKRFKQPKPGRYLLVDKMSNNELINKLRIGTQLEVNVTFNNKNSLEELAGYISHLIEPDSISLLEVMKDENFITKNGFTKENILLMYIPNTYRMYYNTTAEGFRNKMLKEYHRFWNTERKELAKKNNLTPIEVGILASIIQKETIIEKELPRIAGVYINRLKRKELLRADPTVVYAYQQRYGKDLIIRRVLNKHLKVDSPYNTYKYSGLPPGPISMPDIQSIEAVLHFEKHNFLYFVADFNKPGYHIFTRTFKEHNRYARTYRSNLNKSRIFK